MLNHPPEPEGYQQGDGQCSAQGSRCLRVNQFDLLRLYVRPMALPPRNIFRFSVSMLPCLCLFLPHSHPLCNRTLPWNQ